MRYAFCINISGIILEVLFALIGIELCILDKFYHRRKQLFPILLWNERVCYPLQNADTYFYIDFQTIIYAKF